MSEKKYKVAWKREIIARDMRLDDALLFIRALCDKYYNEEVEIELLESCVPEESEEYIDHRLDNYNNLLKSGILDCCKDEH